MTDTHIEIIGTGVAGLCSALLFADAGCRVTLRSASRASDPTCCSWWAGGMLAPWCELESAHPLVAELGLESIAFWREFGAGFRQQGSLVLATSRDEPDLAHFASKTREDAWIDATALHALEPDLAERFDKGLFFADECHLDPRATLQGLFARIDALAQVQCHLSVAVSEPELASPPRADWRIDCRGLAARDTLRELRGVRGEMLVLESPELSLSRPVRLLHPRYPVYIVPRDKHRFMVGATMLESEDTGPVTARSLMELLSAAYALHPALGEARLVETGADARPAFPDNLPGLRRRGNTLYLNGLFRHGFLCAPALARRAVALALHNEIDERVSDEIDD